MMNGSEILALPMGRNDAGATTIAGYLREMLHQIWREGESFSGKRPFGNSGWEDEVYAALIKGGAVKGHIDEDGCVDEIDDLDADKAIETAIDALR